MCIEDIRIGRNTQSRVYYLTANAAPKLAIPANANRITISFWSSIIGGVIWTPRSESANGQGLFIPGSDRPVTLDIGTFGEIVYGDWWLDSPAGDRDCSAVEILYLGNEAPGSDFLSNR